jgi:hypothetical protein
MYRAFRIIYYLELIIEIIIYRLSVTITYVNILT